MRGKTKEVKDRLHLVTLASSAGGLEALKRFLSNAEPDGGTTYVVIQHLDPTHESMFPQLLQKVTSLTVGQVQPHTRLKADHVYVIPPNRYLEVRDQHLELFEPPVARGHRMAIDHFLRSAAESFGPQCACCILSGSGTDGSQGAKAIKESGGLVLVQDPGEAGFDGMPRSTISGRLADRVLSAADMPALIAGFFDGEFEISPTSADGNDALKRILQMVKERTGYDFYNYKNATLTRRIQRRMRFHLCDTPQEYIDRLIKDDEEVHALRKDLLISVTHFFRDPEIFRKIKDDALSEMCERIAQGDNVRIWVPAVATGEEAYSIAILLQEVFEHTKRTCQVQIFATDVDQDALETARVGWYPRSIEADVSSERLERWFTAERGGYRIHKNIREMVTFAQQNLLDDPPYSRLDMITCRNLMIYLESNVQQQIVSLFHFALKPDGILVLGPAEAVAQHSGMFQPVDKKHRIYRRLDTPRQPGRQIPSSPFERQFQAKGISDISPRGRLDSDLLAQAAQRALARHEKICIAVVDSECALQYVLGESAPYMEIPAGVMDRHLGNLVRQGLRAKVRMIMHQAIKDEQAEAHTTARMQIEGKECRVTITCRRVDQANDLYACIFVYHRTEPPTNVTCELDSDTAAAARIAELEQELNDTRRDLVSTIQQLETTNEELRASNEEVVSVNEEVQSTNEELETSKEELQSLNEELTTVNQQLQDKMTEVYRSHEDMANLLASSDIATVFLDPELCIRRTTEAADAILNTRPTDAGRRLRHFASPFHEINLTAEAQKVLSDKQPREHEALADNGRWYSIRILPYRNTNGQTEGVVLTLVDIDRLKKTQEQIENEPKLLDTVLETLPTGLVIADANGRITRDNQASRELWGIKLEADSWEDYDDFVAWWPETQQRITAEEWAMTRALQTGEVIRNELILNQKFNSDEQRYFINNVAPIRDASGNITGGVAALQDVTERMAAEKAYQETAEMFQTLADHISQFAWMADATGWIFWYNQRWFDYTGTTLEEMKGWGWQKVHHPDHVDRVTARFKEAIEKSERWEDTFPLRSAGGEYRWFLSRALPIRDPHGRILRWFGTNTDVTERLQAEQALEEEHKLLDQRVRERTRELEKSQQEVRQLHHLTATAEQRERRRIAEGLHDNVQQLLSAARMGLSVVLPKIHEEKDHHRLAQTEQWICEALEATRSLIFDLSPAVLYEMGLEPAVRHLIGELKERFNLEVKLTVNQKNEPADESVRVFLFSAVRELLFNVVKHAHTKEAEVEISSSDGRAMLVVRDQGCGFEQSAINGAISDSASEATSLGLKMLKERAAQFGGDLELDTTPGNGCTITLWTHRENQ